MTQEKTRQDIDRQADATLERVLENSLLSASKQKDKAKSWERQFTRYIELKQDMLLQIACKITGCWHAARDVVQDSFIAFHQQLFRKGFTGDSIGGWLVTVTTNNALGHLRKEKTREAAPISDIDDPAAPSQDCPLERAEALAEVQRRIEQLPEQQRRAFVLRLYEGWSYEAIGQRIGVSAATAKQYCHKAKQQVKQIS